MTQTFTLRQGDRVRLDTDGPSPTDPVGEVIEIAGSWVRVRWPGGSERTYLPVALVLVLVSA